MRMGNGTSAWAKAEPAGESLQRPGWTGPQARGELAEMSPAEQRGATIAGKVGLLARAVVSGLIGAFLLQAALQANPNEARGLDGALKALAQQPYGPWLLSLVAVGLTTTMVLTAYLHIGVVIGLLPTTGLTLPFVSYGRSNLVISLLMTGVLVNIGSTRERVYNDGATDPLARATAAA